jgi:D-sedoheptulose 7-phosphate isomerase
MVPTTNTSNDWIRALAGLLEGTSVRNREGASLAPPEAFRMVRDILLDIRAAGRRVMVVGNGGSAAIASHMQTDLAHSLGIRALVFTEPSVLTAQANDHGYEVAYRNLVNLWGEPGDLLVAISSSGRSKNILNACEAARAKGARVVTLSGFGPDNPLRSQGDLNFYVESSLYGPVECAHQVLVHHLTDQVLAALSPAVPK